MAIRNPGSASSEVCNGNSNLAMPLMPKCEIGMPESRGNGLFCYYEKFAQRMTRQSIWVDRHARLCRSRDDRIKRNRNRSLVRFTLASEGESRWHRIAFLNCSP